MTHHPLKGSHREPMPGAKSVGDADPSERMEVTVLLRRGHPDALQDRMQKLTRREAVGPHLSREAFEKQFGAANKDIEGVRTFARAHNLAVVQEHAGRRSVVLSGTVGQFNSAFGVALQRFEYPGGSYRGRTGQVMVPDELRDSVEAVLGLDNRPVAKAHFRTHRPSGNVHWNAAAAEANTSYSPLQVAEAYGFPSGTGKGECVGIIELGGGERTSDLTKYFSSLGIKPSPKVIAVSVDLGKNAPTGDPNGPDGEVMLDIEVVGAIAPQARIAVYFADNSDQGFLDAITTAIHDTTNKPSVISISWGGPESSWTDQSKTSFDAAFQDAAAMGITVCVASGDNGSGDGLAGDNVDFPASSPHVLACGGTNLQASGDVISAETVWNGGAQGGSTGGGISTFFALPDWQDGLSAARTSGAPVTLAFRGVPDVSGDADPASGYNVRIDGTNTVIGGTSAVAPLWAGLIARINATNGTSVGFINPRLYASPNALRDITEGNNGDFAAAPGWDACTGLGSPNGAQVAAVLSGADGSTPTS